MIAENIKTTLERIAAAAGRAGRDPREVSLIAVSKTKPEEMIRQALQTGCLDYGENKVQELVRKREALPETIRWHFIGNLQKNKVRALMGRAYLIHSVSSIGLAEVVSREAQRAEITCPVLLEVNVAREESKGGFLPEELEPALEAIRLLPGITVRGLMTVAPFTDDPEENRPIFRWMRETRDAIAQKQLPGVDMKELSMGMSGDFEVAVEEGATFVRVGTSIFGERNYTVS